MRAMPGNGTGTRHGRTAPPPPRSRKLPPSKRIIPLDSVPKRSRGRPRKDPRTVNEAWFTSQYPVAGLRNQADMAERAQIGKDLVNKILKGTREASGGDVAVLARVLDVMPDELLRNLGYVSPPNSFQASGAVRADGRVVIYPRRRGPIIEIRPLPKHAIALRYEAATSGGPSRVYDDATIIYAGNDPAGVPPSVIGRLCILESEREDAPRIGTLLSVDRHGTAQILPLGANVPVTVRALLDASPIRSILFGT